MAYFAPLVRRTIQRQLQAKGLRSNDDELLSGIVNATFARVFRDDFAALRRWDRVRPLSAYLWRVAVNESRRESERRRRVLERPNMASLGRLASSSDGPVEAAERAESKRLVAEAARALTQPRRARVMAWLDAGGNPAAAAQRCHVTTRCIQLALNALGGTLLRRARRPAPPPPPTDSAFASRSSAG